MNAPQSPIPTRVYGVDPLPVRCRQCGSRGLFAEPPSSGSEPGRVACTFCGYQPCWLIPGPQPLARFPLSTAAFSRRATCSALCAPDRGHDADAHEVAGYQQARTAPDTHARCQKPRTLTLRGVVRVGPLTIDAETPRLTVGDRELHLTPTETRLLCALAMCPGQAVSHMDLIASVWNENTALDGARASHLNRVNVARLRIALGEYASLIETVSGVGYRLVAP